MVCIKFVFIICSFIKLTLYKFYICVTNNTSSSKVHCIHVLRKIASKKKHKKYLLFNMLKENECGSSYYELALIES